MALKIVGSNPIIHPMPEQAIESLLRLFSEVRVRVLLFHLCAKCRRFAAVALGNARLRASVL